MALMTCPILVKFGTINSDGIFAGSTISNFHIVEVDIPEIFGMIGPTGAGGSGLNSGGASFNISSALAESPASSALSAATSLSSSALLAASILACSSCCAFSSEIGRASCRERVSDYV